MLKSSGMLIALCSILSLQACSTAPSVVPSIDPPLVPASLLEKCPDLEVVECPQHWMLPCPDDTAKLCPTAPCLGARLILAAESYYRCQERHSALSDRIMGRQK